MNVKFRIISTDPAEHCIVVRFYTDKLPEEKLVAHRNVDGSIARCRTDVNLMLPVPAPTGNELRDYILLRAPTTWLAMKEAIEDPEVDTSLSAVQSEVGREFGAPLSPQEPMVRPKIAVTMRQARRVLADMGKIAQIEAIINAMPEPQKTKARIDWEYSGEVQRHNGLVAQLGPALGLSETQIDELFAQAALIE